MAAYFASADMVSEVRGSLRVDPAPDNEKAPLRGLSGRAAEGGLSYPLTRVMRTTSGMRRRPRTILARCWRFAACKVKFIVV